MSKRETNIRETIGAYVELLKKERGFTIKRIVEEAANVANSRAFSEATLVRCYHREKQDKQNERKYYAIAIETLEIIADTLRAIIRNECAKSPELEAAVKNAGIDLSPDKDFSPRQMAYKKTISVDSIKEGKFYTWAETKRLEMEARKMYVITPDLTNCLRIIDDLIDATLKNKEKESFYMLTDREGIYNKEEIEKKINSYADEDLKRRIQILPLYNKPLYNEALPMQDAPTTVPVILNTAIYFDVIHPFTGERVDFLGASSLVPEDEKQGADYMFSRDRAKKIVGWFNTVWKGLTTSQETL